MSCCTLLASSIGGRQAGHVCRYMTSGEAGGCSVEMAASRHVTGYDCLGSCASRANEEARRPSNFNTRMQGARVICAFMQVFCPKSYLKEEAGRKPSRQIL